MANVLFWEDVHEGMEVPPLVKHPTTQQLVKYAGASGDFYQIHYDTEFAKRNGLPGVIIHGALKNAFLAQLMTGWIGEHGWLCKLSCQYRGMDMPGDTLTCKGVVTRKHQEGSRHLVDCDIWLENGKGEKTTPGAAMVQLPSRSAPPIA
ncbi:MAG: acyl dehydratase [Chloroflexi bacterium]|nr:acyl dehydratase [Chloroflexota bacterium]